MEPYLDCGGLLLEMSVERYEENTFQAMYAYGVNHGGVLKKGRQMHFGADRAHFRQRCASSLGQVLNLRHQAA
ncbi:hypothetical protein [Pantoea sp. Cy-639]|uniref:hypothetical protein n=1 Tax=Pantoea sp. Cy-639 TaxID=2608360 RepID=UPI00141E04C2|nr:hypothetical protein [Pantoea sp. Cy-639]NIF15775.1 hypothetical protein [Pantoea sp. Cy-639]